MLIDAKTNREVLTTAQAVERSRLSKTYLTQLLRKGELEGFQLAREWLIYTDSLEHFLATPRKPGPHGPRKKSVQEQVNRASTNGSDTI